jgi:hypothetical protein
MEVLVSMRGLISGVALAGGLLIPTVAAAQAIQLPPVPLAPSTVNPCTGEPVTMTGDTRVVLYMRADTNGGIHFTQRTITKGRGETVPATLLGATVKYQLNSEDVSEFYLSPTGLREATTVINYIFVRQGEQTSAELVTANDDDFMMKSTTHVTLNANGTVTATVDHSHDNACAGPTR